ncbi:MAG: TetR family transcriptional regulator [Dehalococcoidia bacterium]
MAAPETSLRKRHLDRTRQSIIEAAYELFHERGFAATTVDDIAERADVAPRTFFRYFPTKESVLFSHQGKLQAIRERLAERPLDEPIGESLIAVMLSLGSENAMDQRYAELICRLSSENDSLIKAQRREMMELFTEGLVEVASERTGIPANDVRLQATVGSLMACIAAAISCWFDNGAEGELRPYIEEALTACRAAFGATPSR